MLDSVLVKNGGSPFLRGGYSRIRQEKNRKTETLKQNEGRRRQSERNSSSDFGLCKTNKTWANFPLRLFCDIGDFQCICVNSDKSNKISWCVSVIHNFTSLCLFGF
ncbi:hypothetical protein AVEN_142322-1 [Araneus ventricosus]|uniref:Uncharacterized protein n=1 Tax=Araneus ventricosus TaxID=182803 RepID=A0A4Y2KTN1_ARAVE|nr:hypothetical protein AVEN_142322-1 [Araneus ventricosus]